MSEPAHDACHRCNGEGTIDTQSPSDCAVRIDACCGGCYGEIDCPECGGTGTSDYDEPEPFIGPLLLFPNGICTECAEPCEPWTNVHDQCITI